MEADDLFKFLGIGVAGGIVLFAILLMAKPLYNAFKPLAEISSVPTVIFAGLILFAIALTIFQKIARNF